MNVEIVYSLKLSQYFIGNHTSDKAIITSAHGEEDQDMDLILRGITSSRTSKEEDENLR